LVIGGDINPDVEVIVLPQTAGVSLLGSPIEKAMALVGAVRDLVDG
jgi:hypothetical protein